MNIISEKDIFDATMISVLVVVLAIATVSDFKNRRIPNLLLFPALSLALILHTMSGGADGLITAAGGLFVGLAMFLPLYAVHGMGAGDVKLLSVVGCFLGPWGAVVAGMATMMAGAAFGMIFIAWQCVRPILESQATRVLGRPNTGAHLLTVSHSLGDRNPVTKIPYAPAIAAGTLAALWYLSLLPRPFLELVR